MTEAFAFILKHWRLIAIAALVAGLGVQTWRVGNLKDDLKLAKVEAARALDQCHANVSTLDQALAGQNASIADLKREADAINTAAGAQIRAAQADSVKARRDVAAIMAKRPGGDVCASALELMREP